MHSYELGPASALRCQTVKLNIGGPTVGKPVYVAVRP